MFLPELFASVSGSRQQSASQSASGTRTNEYGERVGIRGSWSGTASGTSPLEHTLAGIAECSQSVSRASLGQPYTTSLSNSKSTTWIYKQV